MQDWTSGYVADIEYTYGYYNELNPLRSRLALLKSGIPCPTFENACELGFGQGLSVNIHAAATETKWYGNDFNPAQAGFAQNLANISSNSSNLSDEAFEEFCSRADLPNFDYIGLHGIWTWVSDNNRSTIVDFIRRKLKVGGVLYVSYNTFPGWSGFAPIRNLLVQHSSKMGSAGSGSVEKIENALSFVDKALDTKPIYAAVAPHISKKLEKMKAEDKHYLAHEYFNKDWKPMYFSEISEVLTSAKLDYACSANYSHHLDTINHSEEQLELLNSLHDISLKESLRDVMCNTQFRQDYWVKGARKIATLEQIELIKNEQVMLAVQREDIDLKFECIRGEALLNESIYNNLLSAIGDNETYTVGAIAEQMESYNITLVQVVECLITLSHRGEIVSITNDKITERSVEKCSRLNRYLINLSKSNSNQAQLASPKTGGGIHVPRIEQLFILALVEGKSSVKELAEYVWDILHMQGHKIVKDGETLQSDEENLARLLEVSADFMNKRFLILKKLMVIPSS